MRLPWVSRAAYNDLRASARQQGDNAYRYQEGLLQRLRDGDVRFDALLEKYHSLRKDGFSPVKPAKVIEAKDPEARVIKAHEHEFLENAASALQKQFGYDRGTAMNEARRMRAEIDDMHPSGQ